MSVIIPTLTIFFFFFFNDPATTEIYTLSLHDALPISGLPLGSQTLPQVLESPAGHKEHLGKKRAYRAGGCERQVADRKSTRLNSSHTVISYAVFCLKKKKTKKKRNQRRKKKIETQTRS